MPGKNFSPINKEELYPLLVSIAEGDVQAFATLTDAFWKNVYYHALTYTRSSVLAEEATQDIFMKVWDNRLKLPGLDNFENFLFIIARNFIISAMRKKDHRAGDELNDELAVEKALQPDLQLEYKESYQKLLKGIEQMPPQRKQVFSMSRLEGLSHEEISTRLGISKNTIKEHIIKGLNFLRLYVKDDMENILLILLVSAGILNLF